MVCVSVGCVHASMTDCWSATSLQPSVRAFVASLSSQCTYPTPLARSLSLSLSASVITRCQHSTVDAITALITGSRGC